MIKQVTKESLEAKLKELDSRIKNNKNRNEIIFLRKEYRKTFKKLKEFDDDSK